MIFLIFQEDNPQGARNVATWGNIHMQNRLIKCQAAAVEQAFIGTTFVRSQIAAPSVRKMLIGYQEGMNLWGSAIHMRRGSRSAETRTSGAGSIDKLLGALSRQGKEASIIRPQMVSLMTGSGGITMALCFALLKGAEAQLSAQPLLC